MVRRKSREERKKAFLEQAGEMFEEIEAWYDEHPDADFETIEGRARQARRKMMGASLGIFINGRDDGKQEEAPACESCGGRMKFQGYRWKRVVGLEGETQLERAYYVCARCKQQTFFPPG